MSDDSNQEVPCYTTGQAAEALHVVPKTISKLCDSGAMPHRRDNRNRLIAVSDFNAFLEKHGIPLDIADQKVYTTGDVAQILHVTPNTVRNLCDGCLLYTSPSPRD